MEFGNKRPYSATGDASVRCGFCEEDSVVFKFRLRSFWLAMTLWRRAAHPALAKNPRRRASQGLCRKELLEGGTSVVYPARAMCMSGFQRLLRKTAELSVPARVNSNRTRRLWTTSSSSNSRRAGKTRVHRSGCPSGKANRGLDIPVPIEKNPCSRTFGCPMAKP
jgi:hypothetical protein